MGKIDKCHIKQKLAKFIQEEIDILNSPMSIKQTEFATKDPFTERKTKNVDSFTSKFYKNFQEKLIPVLTNFSKKLKRECLPNIL